MSDVYNICCAQITDHCNFRLDVSTGFSRGLLVQRLNQFKPNEGRKNECDNICKRKKINEMLTCNGKRITKFRGLKCIMFTPVSLCGRFLTRFAYSRRNGRLRRKKISVRY